MVPWQLTEVVGEQLAREVVDPVAEILANAADGARIGINRLGLQALELQVFEVGLAALIERRTGAGHGVVNWGGTLHNHSIRIDGVRHAA